MWENESLLGNLGNFANSRDNRASQAVLVVKDLPANAGDTRDTGSIPESGRPPGVGSGN